MTLVTHSFQLGDRVRISLPNGAEVSGRVVALLQRDRLKVAVTDELTVSVPAEVCRPVPAQGGE